MIHGRRSLTIFLPALMLALLSLGIASTGVAADGPTFSLQPTTSDPAVPASQSYFILDAQPGQTTGRAVRVQNRGAAVGTVHLYPVDGTTGQNSGAVYLSETDPRADVGAWIAIDGTAYTLNPGESRDVPFTVTVPSSPRAGQHLGGIVAEDTALKTNGVRGGGASATIKTQTIMAVQVTVPGPTVEHLAVTGVTAGGDAGRQLLLLGLRNEGTTMVAPTGTLVVTNAQGAEVQNLPLKLDKVLPATAIQYPVAVQTKALDAGEYQASVTLTYGQSGETRDTAPFTITPAQIAQVFPTGRQAAATIPATLVAPGSRADIASAPSNPAAPQPAARTAVAPWLLIVGGIGGVLLLGLVGGGILLGRGKRA
jgi:hypothetical protein